MNIELWKQGQTLSSPYFSQKKGKGKKKCKKEPSLALIWILTFDIEFKPENGKKQKKTRMIFIDLQLIAVNQEKQISTCYSS